MFTESSTIFQIEKANGIPQPIFMALVALNVLIIKTIFANMRNFINDGELAILIATHRASAFVFFIIVTI
jgi:hypothetical protein